ncbi:hypothetical protein SJI19_21755 [Acerihabitans sp. TG2]|uniref:hypothetical protein n=1 Tax=Acerihabitans sp. TG2 TaxID=3096008 RepID=UPI002B226B79|nr:hypothetical protein [Acerihabitans sp. TG2]MEA9393129.1 hypothetical protein [Acerihabitans sp. TG2]
MTIVIAWILSHLSLIGGGVAALVGIITTVFGLGHSKGKATAETAAKIETVEAEKQAIKDMATRQTTVTTEAANVQENVNHMSDADVDSELLSKYAYPADKDGSR